MCEALGLVPNDTTRIEIIIEPGDLVMVRASGLERDDQMRLVIVGRGHMADVARIIRIWRESADDPVVERNHG